jgi:hypothetical protein
MQPNGGISQPEDQAGNIICSFLRLVVKGADKRLMSLTKKVSSMASVAPIIRSSSHVWSQVKQANRASI